MSGSRLSTGFATGLLAVLAAGGCGDDVSVTPDGRPIDAREIDAPPDAREFEGYFADEGGEVRFEYVEFASGQASARVTSFLFKDPGSMKYWPFLNQNGCNDVLGDTVWPTAFNPLTEQIPLDPGLVVISGGPQTFTLPRQTAALNDNAGKPHAAGAWGFHYPGSTGTGPRLGEGSGPATVTRPAIINDGPLYFTEKTFYDVTFTGSADLGPAQVFDNAIYVPGDYANISPPFTATPVYLPPGQDMTFTRTVVDTAPPPGVEVLSTVVFTGPNGGPVVVCVERADGGDGSITVPAAMIDKVRATYPTGTGTLARQNLTHFVRELVDETGPTGRRIDFIGVWCYNNSFTAVAPP